MVYAKGSVINGKVVLSEQQTIDTSTLTADCFMIQIKGAEACTTCENLNKPRKCGGMKVREKFGVPPPVVKKKPPFKICHETCSWCRNKGCLTRNEEYIKH
jgi:hypothetical protein